MHNARSFQGRIPGTSPHGLSPSTHYEKLDYGRCVDPKGNAGILPASAGILPACWCRRRIALGARPSLRQDAEGSRLEACAPLPIHAHGYFRSRGNGRLEPRRLERSQAGAWERVPMGFRPPRIMKSWITGGASIRRGARASCPHQPASCRRAGAGVGLHSARAQASGRMPKAAGWKPALPFRYTRMGIFGAGGRGGWSLADWNVPRLEPGNE